MSGLGDNLRDVLGVCSRSSILVWVGVPIEDPMGDPMGNLMSDPIKGALHWGKCYMISKI